MQVFRYRSAVAEVRKASGGIAEVTYTGPIGLEAFDRLREKVLAATADASGLLIFADDAVLVLDALPEVHAGSYPMFSPPAAFVVRPEHYAAWCDYGQRLAAIGVRRTFWLRSQLDVARDWLRNEVAAGGRKPGRFDMEVKLGVCICRFYGWVTAQTMGEAELTATQINAPEFYVGLLDFREAEIDYTMQDSWERRNGAKPAAVLVRPDQAATMQAFNLHRAREGLNRRAFIDAGAASTWEQQAALRASLGAVDVELVRLVGSRVPTNRLDADSGFARLT